MTFYENKQKLFSESHKIEIDISKYLIRLEEIGCPINNIVMIAPDWQKFPEKIWSTNILSGAHEVFPKEDERYFIQKPIENEDLIERVNSIISSR